MIRIDDLTVQFGGVIALDAVSLDIADAIVGIIGPNGAGKTTLINTLSGFVAPTRGSVDVDNFDLLGHAPHLRARWGLARSFQKVQIVEDLTVADHVAAVLDCHSMPAAERRSAETAALDFVGLTGFSSALGNALNPFQRRMTEIARCLAAQPRIVLLDEPGGGLSEAEMDMLRRILSAIPERYGAQVLLIDHDVELIRATCGKTAVLDFGRLIAYGPTDQVLQDPQVKAAYLGLEPAA